jgi:hypothetical protein
LRRRFAGKTGFGRSRRKFLQSKFRQSFESSPESRGSQTSGVLLVLFVHAKRINPFPFREIRGFPNLESAHRNGSSAPQQLKPFKEESRFSKPQISTLKQQIRTNQLNPFETIQGLSNFESAYSSKNFPTKTFH